MLQLNAGLHIATVVGFVVFISLLALHVSCLSATDPVVKSLIQFVIKREWYRSISCVLQVPVHTPCAVTMQAFLCGYRAR